MDQVDLTGDGPASPAPRAARRSSAGGTKRPRASVDLSNEDDGSTAVVKRSLRIAALEGKAQQKAAEEELEKEKGQQMVLHQRIASLLKKVEYMDRKRSDAEDKLREEKKKKAGAGGAEKDKEITKLKRQLAKAGSSGGSPKKLEQQVKQLQAKLDKEVAGRAKQVKSLESKLEKAKSSGAGASPKGGAQVCHQPASPPIQHDDSQRLVCAAGRDAQEAAERGQRREEEG